jgi:hypothetical protein
LRLIDWELIALDLIALDLNALELIAVSLEGAAAQAVTPGGGKTPRNAEVSP